MKRNWLLTLSAIALPFFGMAQTTIVAAEYFFDTDPGIGNATSIPVTSAVTIDVTFSADASGLSAGLHLLGVRVQNDASTWGLPAFTTIYVFPNDPAVSDPIVAAEYFFDTDPGLGNATPIAGVTSGSVIDLTTAVSSSLLPQGIHLLGVRTQNSSGLWSIPAFSTVYVFPNDPAVSESIVAAEYFFDNDPGAGNGTAITGITAGAVIDISTVVDTSPLARGIHVLGVRTQNSSGLWSLAAFSTLYVDHDLAITKLEYFIDTDPGIGNGTQVTIVPPVVDVDTDVVIPTSSLAVGTYTVGVRAAAGDDIWGGTTSHTFTICSFADAAFSVTESCEGTATIFTDNSVNVQAGDLYSWDFDSDGTTDATTSGDQTFTFPAVGSFTATLTIDRAGCTDTFTLPVDVHAVPTANAGPDQDLCVNTATLAGSVPAPGETGSWTIVSGTATITDDTDPATTITGISSYTTVVEWALTNTAGGCSQSDQVTIVSNQPIAAPLVSATASLGSTTNADVQSSATVNPGDVLETSILTQGSKGTASVAADGSINYAPNDGTVGSDVVVYQLCNQCDHCSSNNLEIEILNTPPSITPQPVTATGTTVSINLLAIISDPNDNLDPSTLAITEPPVSGAAATIDASYNLTIDYTGIVFSGTDFLTIEACDLAGECATSVILIEVNIQGDPPIEVFNAVSPNGDGKHDFLEIENIEFYPDNHIFIVNRWGDKVFEAVGYDNDQIKFEGISNLSGGKELPSGTYFYSIDLKGDRVNGFLVLKR